MSFPTDSWKHVLTFASIGCFFEYQEWADHKSFKERNTWIATQIKGQNFDKEKLKPLALGKGFYYLFFYFMYPRLL